MKQVISAVVVVGLSAMSANAQDEAVQWRIEDGGNGHWYDVVVAPELISWPAARKLAESQGGYLATLTSAMENSWVHAQTVNVDGAWGSNGDPYWIYGPWIGAYRLAPSDTQWKWVSGEPWSFTAWHYSQPDSSGQTVISLGGGGPTSPTWADTRENEPVRSYIIEWSADCNNDGIVDYGQILQGQLTDADNNGVPDSCEVDPCPADTNGNGVVNHVDLAAVLSSWGTDGQSEGDADTNNDGIVDGLDLTCVLGGWGPCQ
jgi:hypothetical protein